MKNKFQLFYLFGIIVISILFLVSICCPSIILKTTNSSTTTETRIFILTYLSSQTISSNVVSYNMLSSIICLLICAIFPFLMLSNNKTAQYVSIGMSFIGVAIGSYSLYLLDEVNKSLKSSTNTTVNGTGAIMFSISIFLLFILAISNAFFNLYAEKLSILFSNKINDTSTVEYKLEENKQLFEKGLISQEEYDSRRKTILG